MKHASIHSIHSSIHSKKQNKNTSRRKRSWNWKLIEFSSSRRIWLFASRAGCPFSLFYFFFLPQCSWWRQFPFSSLSLSLSLFAVVHLILKWHVLPSFHLYCLLHFPIFLAIFPHVSSNLLRFSPIALRFFFVFIFLLFPIISSCTCPVLQVYNRSCSLFAVISKLCKSPCAIDSSSPFSFLPQSINSCSHSLTRLLRWDDNYLAVDCA